MYDLCVGVPAFAMLGESFRVFLQMSDRSIATPLACLCITLLAPPAFASVVALSGRVLSHRHGLPGPLALVYGFRVVCILTRLGSAGSGRSGTQTNEMVK